MTEARSALGARVATALVLAPLAIAAVVYLPTPWLGLVLGAIVALGAVEWARLGGVAGGAGTAAVVGYQLALLGVGHWLAGSRPGWLLPVLAVCAGWWLGVGAVLVLRRDPVLAETRLRPLLLVGAPLLTGLAWLALVRLHSASAHGPGLVLLLLVLIWGADTAAYFAGRAFGRRRLAPAVSPGKTVAGLVGALAAAAACGVALAAAGLSARLGYGAAVGLCVGVVLASVAGDLFESYAKRAAGVKDSGQLLPGHGGVLDRIDSLIAAAPVFLLGWLYAAGPA